MTRENRRQLTISVLEAADYVASLNDTDAEFWPAVAALRDVVAIAKRATRNDWLSRALTEIL